MKNNKLILGITLLVLFTYSSNAQETNSKNYVLSNISYAFFGTGDISGSAVGVAYHHMFLDKFGANISYSKASAHSSDSRSFPEDYTIENADERGNNFAFDISSYNSANIGLTYRTIANPRHELLAGAGLNYKSTKNNYPNATSYNHDDNTITILHYTFEGYRDIGFYISFDYLFFIKEHFSIGIHAAYENTPDVLTSVGLSLGCRF